ncbi:MAG: glycosyltransferase [Oscillospiraceae bacterium]|nr:glycosyltransferase [Oscillospiraceae bacterium]
MTGYYIHENYIEDGVITVPGVHKKVGEQIKIMGLDFSVQEVLLNPKPNTTMNKLLRRLPWGSNTYYWDEIIDQIVDPAYIYIRKPLLDNGLHKFLKQFRKKYPKTKILLEIPTYPYDKEMITGVKDYPLYWKELIYRNKLQQFVDRVVTYSDDKTIFGIPTICIQNGVNVTEHPIRETKANTDEIHLIAVASFQKYHGYERVINGLAEYYRHNGTRKIVLDMVGGGDELAEYRKLTELLNLQEHVVFWGPKHGEKLKQVFDQADIGLGSFGFYKIGLTVASSLKLREYLARGLPVIGGSRQDLFTEETFPYYLEFPNDASNLDMERIIAFYNQVYRNDETYEEVVQRIRKYAEENVTWKKTFAPVMEYLGNQ